MSSFVKLRAAGAVHVMSPQNPRKWSQRVTDTSGTLDLEPGVFTWSDPKMIAASLKSSAEENKGSKISPFRSAMSMLSLYINRAGRNLDKDQKAVLERAKLELRTLLGK